MNEKPRLTEKTVCLNEKTNDFYIRAILQTGIIIRIIVKNALRKAENEYNSNEVQSRTHHHPYKEEDHGVPSNNKPVSLLVVASNVCKN